MLLRLTLELDIGVRGYFIGQGERRSLMKVEGCPHKVYINTHLFCFCVSGSKKIIRILICWNINTVSQ